MTLMREYSIPTIAAVFFFLTLIGVSYQEASARSKGAERVGIVFFSSNDCPHCSTIKYELRRIQRLYPIKLLSFNIDNPKAYALFTNLESIHSSDGFGVPLIMLGESILMGEAEIKKRLEPTVRRLMKSGRSPLPYLGPAAPKKRARKRNPPKCPNCDRRPPTLGEEWGNIRTFVDKIF